MKNKTILALCVFPVFALVSELPKMFGPKMVKFGAQELVSITPGLTQIENDKIYSENPDTLYTFDTYWDSMTGNSLRLRQLYYRFNLLGIVVHGWDLMSDENTMYDEGETGRSFIQNNFDKFIPYLKRTKSKFWGYVKKDCKAKNVSFKDVKKQVKLALNFENGILDDLLKVDEPNLQKLYEMFVESGSEYRYLIANEGDYPDNPELFSRNKINGFLHSLQGIYRFKTLKFIKQNNDKITMDHAWYFNLAMLVKYNHGSNTETLIRFKKILEILD